MNAEIIKLVAEGKDPNLYSADDAQWRFYRFLFENLGASENKWNIAGKNFNGFDKPFILNCFKHFKDVFHHRVADPATQFRRRGDKHLPDLKTCLERAGITETNVKLKGFYEDGSTRKLNLHQALDDATAVMLLVRYLDTKNNHKE